jgi:hypothetical protein
VRLPETSPGRHGSLFKRTRTCLVYDCWLRIVTRLTVKGELGLLEGERDRSGREDPVAGTEGPKDQRCAAETPFPRIPYARNPVSENYPYRKPKLGESGLAQLHCPSAPIRGLSVRPCSFRRSRCCWSCPCSTGSPLCGNQTCCTPCRDRQITNCETEIL